MIKKIQAYLESTYPEITCGQVQTEPDALINVNIYDTGVAPFFNSSAKVYNLDLFIRESRYEDMQDKHIAVTTFLLDIYNVVTDGIHIVTTTSQGALPPQRDMDNRYIQLSSFEMLVEQIGG